MRQITALSILLISLAGCMDRIICPAFQSTYILDDSVRNVYYSYLWKLDKDERLKYLASTRPAADTSTMVASLATNATDYFAYVEPYVVPEPETRKTKFGIVKYEPYWLQKYQLRTAPMENVLAPPPPVEKDTAVDVGEFIASDFDDSLAVDNGVQVALEDSMSTPGDTSTFELPKLAQAEPPKTRKETTYLYRYDPADSMLNVEQEYYNWYFGEYLVREREVPINPEGPAETLAEQGNFWSKVKAFFQFNWLSKNKENSDDLVADEETEEGVEPVEETAEPEEETPVEEDPNDGF